MAGQVTRIVIVPQMSAAVDTPSGAIPFISGSSQLVTDDSNLHWDEVNNRLGIGTKTPTSALDLNGGTISNATMSGSISSLAKVSTAQLDRATSTVLTNIPGLSVNVVAGATYLFRAHIAGVGTANGGAKFAIGGTATATSITYTGRHMNAATTNAQTNTQTLGNAVGASTAVFTDGYIEGAIVVNAAGTLTVQLAQNASHADITSALINSDFHVVRVA